MNKSIIMTTISSPGKFIETINVFYNDWTIYVAGDLKTPHNEYQNIDNVVYIYTSEQEEINKELSDLVGWNTPDRRCFAMIRALNDGADIIALMDDDNIPFEKGWDAVLPGDSVAVDIYFTEGKFFDPLSVTSENIWHRGYPISELNSRESTRSVTITIKPDVVAGLWRGTPDIDAECKVIHSEPEIGYDDIPFTAPLKYSPFNSQNTFLSRKIAKNYMSIIGVGRVGDIWGSYLVQPCNVVYTKPTVTHERHPHDIGKDMKAELYSYSHSFENLPKDTLQALELYKKSIK
jgi:hypothetical protein